MREQEVGFANIPVAGQHQRYEYLTITVEAHENLKDARSRISEHTEYGKWELARSTILYGGRRRYWMRRRVMRVLSLIHI